MSNILATGRSLGVNVIAATQMPTAAAVGKLVARLFTLRLIGRQDSARAAALVAGRPDTGAHELMWPGDFLWIDADVLRFKAYAHDASDTATTVAAARRQWPGAVPAAATPEPEAERPRVDEAALQAQDLLAQGYSKNAICNALWQRPYAGGYKAKLDKLLASSTSTTGE